MASMTKFDAPDKATSRRDAFSKRIPIPIKTRAFNFRGVSIIKFSPNVVTLTPPSAARRQARPLEGRVRDDFVGTVALAGYFFGLCAGSTQI